MLLFWQRGLEEDRAGGGGRQGTHEIRRAELGAAPATILDGDGHAVRALDDAPDDGFAQERAPEPLREPCGQAIVPAGDPEDTPVTRRPRFGELLDQRQERQVLGIGEKEPPEAAHGRLERRGHALLLEPLFNGGPGQPRGDGAVPALFRELEVLNVRLQQRLDRRPEARTQLNAPPAADVGSVEAEAVTKNAHRREAELPRERQHVLLLFLDEIRAAFRVLAAGERIADGPHAPSHAVARFNDGDLGAAQFERPCRRQTGQSGPRDDDARSGQIPPGHGSRLHLCHMPWLLLSLLLAPSPASDLKARVQKLIDTSGAEVAVVLRTLDGKDELLIDPDKSFHAASTMKVPVMIELYRQAEAGLLRLDEPLTVKNEFHSIVDGTAYQLSVGDDSDAEVYKAVGKTMTLRELCEAMITVSSNFAVNLLVERVGTENVRTAVRHLGADGMVVRRGVEDQKAFDQRLNNSTTARALATLMTDLAEGKAVSPRADAEMVAILKRQKFNDAIPAGLPPGTPVAHKTGSITKIHHDAAIVYGPRPYVLVVLVRGIQDQKVSGPLMASISGEIWNEISK